MVNGKFLCVTPKIPYHSSAMINECPPPIPNFFTHQIPFHIDVIDFNLTAPKLQLIKANWKIQNYFQKQQNKQTFRAQICGTYIGQLPEMHRKWTAREACHCGDRTKG